MKAMNIIEFSEELQTKMKRELSDLDSNQDELIRAGKSLSVMRELIGNLKSFVRDYTFTDQTEEINFFKHTKPELISQYIYHEKLFAIRLFDSFKDAKSRQANYYLILRKLERFAERNREFYEYCMSGESYLDQHYFTQNVSTSKPLNRDEHFTTVYDEKLAKILANELLKKHLMSSLQRAHQEESGGPMLNWTAPKASLIELIYALHSMEVFNRGTADIKLIASAFENFFNISLGNYYRVIQEIRIRKSGQTNFLDQLKGKLLKRLNEYD